MCVTIIFRISSAFEFSVWHNLLSDSLGFAQLCLICDMTVAQERNSRRQIPIPDSTIVSMERSLELPEGSRCHWESRSTVISNNNCKTDFIRDSLSVTHSYTTIHIMWCDMLCSVKVKELVSGALTNPETSISTLDNEMKVTITYHVWLEFTT